MRYLFCFLFFISIVTTANAQSISLNADQEYLVYTKYFKGDKEPNKAMVWSFTTQKYPLVLHSKETITAVGFSKLQPNLFYAIVRNEGLKCIDAVNIKEINVNEDIRFSTYRIVFNNRGDKMVVFSEKNDRLFIINPETLEVIKALTSKFKKEKIRSVSFSSDDKQLLVGGDRIYLLDTESFKVEKLSNKAQFFIPKVSYNFNEGGSYETKKYEYAEAVAFDPNNNHRFYAGLKFDGGYRLNIFNLDDTDSCIVAWSDHYHFQNLKVTPDGKYISFIDGHGIHDKPAAGAFFMYKTHGDRKLVYELRDRKHENFGSVYDVYYDPNGKFFVLDTEKKFEKIEFESIIK